MMLNSLQYPIALLGALRAGDIVVNCNPLYTVRELPKVGLGKILRRALRE